MNKPLTVLTLRQRLLSGGAWAFVGKLGTAFMALTSNALLARLLTPQEFGAYFLAFSLVLFGALVGSLGLNLAVVRFVAESVGLGWFGKMRSAVAIVLVLGVVGAVCVGITYLIFGHFVAERLFHSPTLAEITGLVAAWMTVMAVQNLLAETFRGFHDIRSSTAFGGLTAGTLLVAGLVAIWWSGGQITLASALYLTIGSFLISNLLAGWLLYRKIAVYPHSKGVEDRMSVAEVLGVSLPLLTANLTFYGLTTQADVWVLGAFRPQEEVAVYGAAVRLLAVLAMPALIVNSVMPPLIAEMYARGERVKLERTLRTVATLVSILALPVLAAFLLMGGPILTLIFGSYYSQGALVLAVLSLGQLANLWSGGCGILLNMTGHHRAAMIITALASIGTVGLSLIAVKNAGMLGVAVTSSAGIVLQNAIMVVYSSKVIGIKPYARFSLSFIKGVSLR